MAFRIKYDVENRVISPLWIDVKSCLPPVDYLVMITDGESYEISYMFDENYYKRKRARTRKDKYPVSIVWNDYFCCAFPIKITHWMELPELPKG